MIVPAANPARITTPADLAGSGVRIVAAAEGVPIERYTRSWLELVAALPAYGPGRANGNFVLAEFQVKWADKAAKRDAKDAKLKSADDVQKEVAAINAKGAASVAPAIKR